MNSLNFTAEFLLLTDGLKSGMPVWYWEKKDLIRSSPSAKDGFDWENESKLRVEGVKLIFDIGSRMKLPYETWATGAVYFHRFYVFRSFKQYDRRVVAISCLFLAGKVEETPKKGKDLLRLVKEVFTEEDFNIFGEDPKETLIVMERIVLKTIQFDLHVEHPYSILLKLLKEFKGTKEYKAPVAQMAWTFVNDSYCTTLCLQWEPDIIAAAMLYLATKMRKDFTIELQNPPLGFDGKWWKIFVPDLGQAVIEDVCHQQLDFISGNFGGSATRKKKKKSSSSASSTPGPGPGPSTSAPAPPSDKRKAPPSTPYDQTQSKKMKSEEITPVTPFPPINFSIPPPPPPSIPPPIPPPPPPSSYQTSPPMAPHGAIATIGGSSIPVHSSQRGSNRTRSGHSPDRDMYNSDKPSNFEGLPIPALISGSNGSHLSNNSGLSQSTSAITQLPPNYPPFTGNSNESRSPSSPTGGGGHPSLRRSISTNDRVSSSSTNSFHGNSHNGRRDDRGNGNNNNGRDSNKDRQSRGDDDNNRHRGSSTASSSTSKSSTSFQSSTRTSRFDKPSDSKNGGSSFGSSGSTGRGGDHSQRHNQPVTPMQQSIKPLISTSEPPPGYRNPATNGAQNDISSAVASAGAQGIFHSSYASAAAYGTARPPGSSPTPFENLVAAVMPRTPMQLAQQFGAMPMTMPPPMAMRPIFSSPQFQSTAGAFPGAVANNGSLARTPTGGHRPPPNFSQMPPSLLPPR